MNLLKIAVLSFVLSSCAFLNSVSQTSIPKDRSKVVTASVTNNIIFLFNFSNDYLNQLTPKLMDQCPNGSVQGILTKDETFTYFPLVFSKVKVTATGYCVEKKSKKRRRSKRAKRR